MTFFEKNKINIWKSLLDLGGNNGDSAAGNRQNSATLDDAAAITRNLNQEESVRPSLFGVMSVKVRAASLIQFDKLVHANTNTYCTLSIRNQTKRTRVVQRNDDGLLRWDQIKHIPIIVVRNRRHPYNLLKVEVFNFDGNEPNQQKPLGSVSFHVHDLIQASPISGTYDLWNEHVQVGDIDLELTFNYGRFGYGYSYQFKEEEIPAEEQVQYSLLPRIIPPRAQREPDEFVMVACATPHPSFIPFKEKVFLSYGKDIKEALEDAEQTIYKPDSFTREMSHFDKIRDQYFSMPDRMARLMYLRSYLTKSTNQQETTVQPPDAHQDLGSVPAKSYTQFVVPINAANLSTGQSGANGALSFQNIPNMRAKKSMAAGVGNQLLIPDRNSMARKSREFSSDD